MMSLGTRQEDITSRPSKPGEGGFINVLFEQDIRPFKFRLLEAFNFITSSNLRKKLFWIIDSCPTLESEEIFSFFAELKEKLPANVKIIIGQREGDILSRNRNVFSPFVFSVPNENEKKDYMSNYCDLFFLLDCSIILSSFFVFFCVFRGISTCIPSRPSVYVTSGWLGLS